MARLQIHEMNVTRKFHVIRFVEHNQLIHVHTISVDSQLVSVTSERSREKLPANFTRKTHRVSRNLNECNIFS